jgi:hypothetical protein
MSFNCSGVMSLIALRPAMVRRQAVKAATAVAMPFEAAPSSRCFDARVRA